MRGMRRRLVAGIAFLASFAFLGCQAEKAPRVEAAASPEPATAPADHVPMLVYLEMMESGAFEAFRRFPWDQWLNPYWKAIGATTESDQRPEEMIALYLWTTSPTIRDPEVLPTIGGPAYPQNVDGQVAVLEQAGLYPEAMALSAGRGALPNAGASHANPYGSPYGSPYANPYGNPQAFGAGPNYGAPIGTLPSSGGLPPSGAPFQNPGLDFPQAGSVY